MTRPWLVGLALLAGCTVGPDFTPPQVQAPTAYGAQRTDVPSRTTAEAVDERWWESFADPTLTALIGRIAAENLDLQAAAERVLQGRAERQIAASQALPQINGDPNYKRTRQSPKGFISLIEPVPGAPRDYDLFQNGLTSSWDLDLFGRVRRQVEVEAANTQAAIEDRHAIALAAVADLAQDYLQLRGTQTLMAIAEQNLRLAERNTALVVERAGNGVATTLDLAQARAQQQAVAATQAPLRTQEAALINAIGFLLGEPPRRLEAMLRPRAALPALPASVPVGLPATLVRRRPDLRQAEAKLHAATAQTGVAVAEFYPDVSLTGSYNLEGLRLKDAFSLYSAAYSFGPQISIPVFQGGRLRGRLDMREAQQREAAITFRRTVLQAWQEVDNALTAYAEMQTRRALLAAAVGQGRVALGAARQRFQQGAADFLNVNATEQQLLQSQTDLANSDVQLATGLVALYRALGGGWQIADASVPSTP